MLINLLHRSLPWYFWKSFSAIITLCSVCWLALMVLHGFRWSLRDKKGEWGAGSVVSNGYLYPFHRGEFLWMFFSTARRKLNDMFRSFDESRLPLVLLVDEVYFILFFCLLIGDTTFDMELTGIILQRYHYGQIREGRGGHS